jgi:uncharacterized membrane protein
MDTVILVPAQRQWHMNLFIFTCMVWFMMGLGAWAYSNQLIESTDTSTAAMGQSYGTHYSDNVHHSFKESNRDLIQTNAWRQYWIEYYTATDETSVIGSSERTTSTAVWYADSTIVVLLSIIFFALMYFFARKLDMKEKYSLLATSLFCLLLSLPLAHIICKVEFLYWVSH